MVTNRNSINDKPTPLTEKQKAQMAGTLNNDLGFVVTEAFKAIRTNLDFALHKSEGCRKVLFTSSIPNEGKTSISANVAITIAQTNTRTLLIDCDLRKPKIHTKFGMGNEVGLSNLLSGMSSLEDSVRPTGRENLWVISSGVLPPNPAELLASEEMPKLISKLEKMFDYIVFDTPPVNIVSDALSLTKLVDGVIVVVNRKVSTHPYLKLALSRLEFVDANVLGIVMNGYQSAGGEYYSKRSGRYGYSKSRYGYSNSYGGGYGYGYGYGYRYGTQNRNGDTDDADQNGTARGRKIRK